MHANPTQMRVASKVTRREMMDDFFDSLEDTIAAILADERDDAQANAFTRSGDL